MGQSERAVTSLFPCTCLAPRLVSKAQIGEIAEQGVSPEHC